MDNITNVIKCVWKDELLNNSYKLQLIEELKDLERLAKLGAAIEKAFEKDVELVLLECVGQRETTIAYDTKTLLEWAEGEK